MSRARAWCSQLETFARVRISSEPQSSLVLAGPWGWGLREVSKTIQRLGQGASVRFSGYGDLTQLAALMLDGLDRGSMFRAIVRLLDHSQLRQELSGKSIKNAGRFSWTAATRETHQVY